MDSSPAVRARDVTTYFSEVVALRGATSTSLSGQVHGLVGLKKVEQSMTTSFAHLFHLQSRELHRPDVTRPQLRTGASCYRAGSHGGDQGPANDWRCVVTWHIPDAPAVGTAVYQLDIAAQGRHAADVDGPQEVNGYFQVRTPTGDAPDPVWQVDGLVDLSSRSSSKG